MKVNLVKEANSFLFFPKHNNMNNKILVIEDNKYLAELIQVNLEANGFNVTTSFNGEDGLKKACTEMPDVITLDVQLPKMDGWEVCRQIKADLRTKDIPVVFLTVVPKEEGEKKARSAGCSLYLTKPFDPSKLADIIQDIIANRRINANIENKL